MAANVSENEKLSEPVFDGYPWAREFHDGICSMASKYAMKWLEIIIAVNNSKEANEEHLEMVLDELKATGEGWVIRSQNIYDKYIDMMGRCVTRIDELVSILGVDVPEEIQETDMPLTENYNWLKARLEKLETMYEEKQKQTKALQEKYELLANKLGQSFRTLPDVMSPQTEENFKLEVESLEQRAVGKQNQFNTKKIEIQNIIKDYDIQLDETLQRKFLEISDESFTVTSQVTESLNQIYECILDKKLKMDTDINTLKARLQELWNSLHFSADERISFLTSTEMPQRELVQRLSQEIARLEEYKEEHLQNLIEENKTALTNLWEQCHCGSSIRNDFPEIYTNDYSEAMLDNFNRQIRSWENFYDQNSEIIVTLNTYTKILKQAEEMKMNNDSRLLYRNRGGKMVEQMKKMGLLKSRIKKTEEKLLKLSGYFLQKNGIPFLSFDRSIETIIKASVNSKKFVTEEPVKFAKSPRAPQVKTPKGDPLRLTPRGCDRQKKIKTPSSQQKRTPNKEMPRFKLNESKTNSPKGKIWKPSAVSLKLARDSGDDSWTSDFSDFEKDIKGKNIPRSSSILK